MMDNGLVWSFESDFGTFWCQTFVEYVLLLLKLKFTGVFFPKFQKFSMQYLRSIYLI